MDLLLKYISIIDPMIQLDNSHLLASHAGTKLGFEVEGGKYNFSWAYFLFLFWETHGYCKVTNCSPDPKEIGSGNGLNKPNTINL